MSDFPQDPNPTGPDPLEASPETAEASEQVTTDTAGEGPAGAEAAGEPVFKSTRNDLHLTRRFFHMANGVLAATLYAVLFSHQQAISLLGTAAGLIYIFEQIRINYPEIQNKIPKFTNFFIRAEEQMKESAMIPYVIAILLSIITFPKPIALIAIYSLAIADPLAAVVGIRFGTRKLVGNKSVEGSAAFFAAIFLITLVVLAVSSPAAAAPIAVAAFLLAMLSAAFEMVPIRIDDNLTIPLFVGFSGWALSALLKIPV